MFYLQDKSKELWQWDSNRTLIVDNSSIVEVHFSNKSMSHALVCQVRKENNTHIVDIPNILLQSFLDIKAYAFDGNATKHEKIFTVKKKPRPDNYIYTETQLLSVKEIAKEEADKAIKESVTSFMPSSPAAFERVPRILRDTYGADTEIDYLTITAGAGGGTVPIRDPDGSMRAKYNKNGPNTTDDTLINQLGLNDALNLINQATIQGFDIPASQSWDDAISKQDYGLYFVKGEDITVEYTANNELQRCTGSFHFIIKYNNDAERIIHIYPKDISIAMGIKIPSITSFDGLLASNIKISNGSTQYGCRVVKMKMKNIQGE
jgi:hypothetical protein